MMICTGCDVWLNNEQVEDDVGPHDAVRRDGDDSWVRMVLTNWYRMLTGSRYLSLLLCNLD